MIKRYVFEVRYKEEENKDWQEIDELEVVRALEHNYIDTDVLIYAMMDGLVVPTSFAQYRATAK